MRTSDSKADAGSGKDEEEDSKERREERGLSRVESEAEEENEAIPLSPKGCSEGLQSSQGSGKRTLGKKRKGTLFFPRGSFTSGQKTLEMPAEQVDLGES